MKTGLERLLKNPRHYLKKARVGLIANPTTVDRNLSHAAVLLKKLPQVDLRLLFGPEHGIAGQVQDMIAVGGARDSWTGLPVVSLYGKTASELTPRPEHLADVDLLLFDIQDIGCRFYTFAATMALCMRAAAASGKRMVVLDRPNPLGGELVEGGGIEENLLSFVGLYPVPQRHGMTVGELARLYNTTFGIGCDLEVIPMVGWNRRRYFEATGLPWVLPSPNMPTVDTALVYPGMCLLEGTNLSEGRGTTRPFELFGAPFIDGRKLTAELGKDELPGVLLRPCFFTPTFHKFAGQCCGGLQLHVTDRRAFLPYRTGLAVLAAVRRLWPRELQWRREEYEFRSDVPAIDLLTGITAVRAAIDASQPLEAIMRLALARAERYEAGRDAALLYP